MAKKQKIPSYCLHKPTGQAYSRVRGRFVYHGEYGSEKSRDNYDRFVCDFLANGRKLPGQEKLSPQDATINNVCLGFLKHVENYGYSAKEIHAFKMAVKRFRTVFGRCLAKNFGPLNLQSFQQLLLEQNCSRKYINKTCERIKRVFKWGTAQELIPPGVFEGLRTVENLKAGRTEAAEYDPVGPVSDATIKKTVKYLPKIPADMVWLLRYTGMRIGELCIMTPADVDRSGETWVYYPSKHKTQHHNKSRAVYIGPKAKAILTPYLENRPSTSFCFSPKESEELRAKEMRAARKSKLTPSQTAREKQAKKRDRKHIKDYYTADSFRRLIARACKKSGIDHWHTHQLRHTAATEYRKKFGLEASQVLLGHSSMAITEVYAEQDRERAIKAIQEVG